MKPIQKLKEAIVEYQNETQTVLTDVAVESSLSATKTDDSFNVYSVKLKFNSKTI